MLPFPFSTVKQRIPFPKFSATMKLGLALVLFSSILFAVQASDVLEFDDSNFETEIQKPEHSTILVEFYAPWCGHCKRLAPEYDKAAAVLAKNDPPMPIAKVDCTANTEVCGKYGVSGYPTLKIFKNGEVMKDYDGGRDKDGIVKTMLKMAGPWCKNLESVEAYEKFLGKDGGSVVGFFKDMDSTMGKNFQKVAEGFEDLRCGYSSSDAVLKKAGYKEELVLFRDKKMANKFEDGAVKFSGDASDKTKVKEFMQKEKMGLCEIRTMSNADQFKKPTFIAFYDVDYVKNPKGSNYWRNRVMKVAKKLRDEGVDAHFAVSNKAEFSHEVGEFGLDIPTEKPVVGCHDTKSRKFKMNEEFSMDTFEKFVREVLAEKLEPHLKSEPVPESQDEPVKVVVAKNFDEIVNDEDRDVLIEFYAPWCGHCKSLAPKFDELAAKLENEPEITIAKMDATANDVPSPYEVRGFPTLFFAPKGSKSSPKKYEGGREVKDFIKYLAKEATNEMKGYDRNGKKKKTEL